MASNDPNQKLDDKQYELLKSAFSADKTLRDKAEERMQDRQEKKRSAKTRKSEETMVETVVPEVKGPHIVGHIDLDAKPAKAQSNTQSANNTKAEALKASAKSINKPQANAATAANTPAAPAQKTEAEEAVPAHANNQTTSNPQNMNQSTTENTKVQREERAKAIGHLFGTDAQRGSAAS